jgi:NitT/TauT family transport system permease protein
MPRLLEPRREVAPPIYWAAAFLGFLVLICLWQWGSHIYAAQGKQILFPGPAKVLSVARDYASGAFATEGKKAEDFQTFAGDVKISFMRVTGAFLLAALTAIPLGVLVGSFSLAEGIVQPATEFIRYVPVPALIPLLIVIFGIEETSKVMLIYVGTFFPMVLMVADEIRRVPYDLLQAGYTLGGSRMEGVREILFPAALPGIFDALRLCNGWAWSWLIVAELVAANQGLGFRIVKYQRFLQTDKIFFYLVVLGLIGLALDLAFRTFNRLAFRWNHAARN